MKKKQSAKKSKKSVKRVVPIDIARFYKQVQSMTSLDALEELQGVILERIDQLESSSTNKKK
jgi:hypothetical protein